MLHLHVIGFQFCRRRTSSGWLSAAMAETVALTNRLVHSRPLSFAILLFNVLTLSSFFMNSVLVLTISGQDRAGLVEKLADVIAEHGGNWEHCRMAHLAGRFVGLLEVCLLYTSPSPRD